jgi:uncharacterized membrane protein
VTSPNHVRSKSRELVSTPRKDSHMEEIIGGILFTGVVISAALLLTGLIWNTIETGKLGFDYTIQGQDLYQFALKDIKGVFTGPLKPQLLLNLGVITLMFTPFLRVAISVLYFAAVQRSFKYALITGIVLVVLAYSLLMR